MSLARLAESLIQEAMARGEFNDLPGRGHPLDLSEYFSAPEEWRAAYALLKNAGLLPREVELMQEIAALKERLPELSADAQRKARQELADKMLQLNLLLERKKR
ncbi:MAG: DUF1992 domain-containing protein [Anaerolineales bacterium]